MNIFSPRSTLALAGALFALHACSSRSNNAPLDSTQPQSHAAANFGNEPKAGEFATAQMPSFVNRIPAEANLPPLPKPRAIKNGRWFQVPNHGSPSGQVTMACKEDVETPFYKYKTDADGRTLVGPDGNDIFDRIAWERTATYYLVDASKGRYRRLSRGLGECYFDVRGYGRAGALWAKGGDRIDQNDERSVPFKWKQEGALVFLQNQYRKHSSLEIVRGSFYPNKDLPYGFRLLGSFDEVVGKKLTASGRSLKEVASAEYLKNLSAAAQQKGYTVPADSDLYFQTSGQSVLNYDNYEPSRANLKKYILEQEYNAEVEAKEMFIGETSAHIVYVSFDSYGGYVTLEKAGKLFQGNTEASVKFAIAVSTDPATLAKVKLDYMKGYPTGKTFALPVRNTDTQFYFKIVGMLSQASLDDEFTPVEP